MGDLIRTMRFTWHAEVSHNDAQMIGICADTRWQRRWRISDLKWKYTPRTPDRGIIQVTWTYGPVHGGRPDDGRKFMERVLHDALDRPLLKDLRDDFGDVIILEQSDAEQLDFFKPLGGG